MRIIFDECNPYLKEVEFRAKVVELQAVGFAAVEPLVELAAELVVEPAVELVAPAELVVPAVG